MKDLILIRGLPGSGKTTLAKILMRTGDVVTGDVSTDDYWEYYHDGEFNPDLVELAHEWTEREVELMMEEDRDAIIVHNTFTQPWEWEAYEDLAGKYGYRVHHLICEKRHGGESTSDVPQKLMDEMESRFQIRLQ